MGEARYHIHPFTTNSIYGYELDPEEFIQKGDCYPDLQGNWSSCADDGFGSNYRAKDFGVFGGPVIRPIPQEEQVS